MRYAVVRAAVVPEWPSEIISLLITSRDLSTRERTERVVGAAVSYLVQIERGPTAYVELSLSLSLSLWGCARTQNVPRGQLANLGKVPCVFRIVHTKCGSLP